MRIGLGVEYDGAGYHGWQAQKSGVRTVQETLEKALAQVADGPVKVICAGRTDAGVHATNQVVHFDTAVERQLKAWIFGTNTLLPEDVSVRWAKQLDDKFHARFSAVSRRYQYVIFNSRIRPALFSQQVSVYHRHLDIELMREGARFLIGEHDFSSFQAVGCQAKSPVRTILELDIKRQGSLVIIEVQANAFLQHMVRNIAGVLMPVGAGLEPSSWVKKVLELKDRTKSGVTARPDGLYLVDVEYPAQYELAGLQQGSIWLDS